MRQSIILASSSPRRHQLLREMGVQFTVLTRETDEHIDAPPEVAVDELAARKAFAVAEALHEGLVLGADTLVALDGRALGKPKDAADARRMLRSLSGREHTVYTGVCLVDARTKASARHVEASRVRFRALSDQEIADYVAGGEPMDKAGAYGIQGAARGFVERIEGSFENVMGLPVQALEGLMAGMEG